MQINTQAKFQHMELIGKREKMNQLKSSMEKDEAERNTHLRTAKEAVRVRREKFAARRAHEPWFSSSSISPYGHLNTSTSKSTSTSESSKHSSMEKMNILLSENGDSMEFFIKFHKLIEKKSAEAEDEAKAFQLQCRAIQKRIVGYQRYMQKDERFVEGIGTSMVVDDGNSIGANILPSRAAQAWDK